MTASRETIAFRLNGCLETVESAADARAIDLLRDVFHLTAAKKACGIGRCGSCAVLYNGSPANACLLMAWQLNGAEIITPEGLHVFPETEVVRKSLALENAFQCGYCAPGHTVILTALLRENPNPSRNRLITALSGNLCRCTGYHSILRGALHAVEALNSAREGTPVRPNEPSKTYGLSWTLNALKP